MFEIDELLLYRGNDIAITDDIIITQPTLEQIANYGERKYFNTIQLFTSVPADMKWQLWDYAKLDYTKLDDYEMFVSFLYGILGSKKNFISMAKSKEEELALLKNPLALIFKDLDFGDFKPIEKNYSGEKTDIVLYNEEKDITFDRSIYRITVDMIRNIHGLKRTNEKPANESTKRDLIDDAREEALMNKKKPQKSILKPLISAYNVEMCCNNYDTWNLKVGTFFYNIKRINKVRNATMLLQGGYSGFANLKNVNKKELDIFGDV